LNRTRNANMYEEQEHKTKGKQMKKKTQDDDCGGGGDDFRRFNA